MSVEHPKLKLNTIASYRDYRQEAINFLNKLKQKEKLLISKNKLKFYETNGIIIGTTFSVSSSPIINYIKDNYKNFELKPYNNVT